MPSTYSFRHLHNVIQAVFDWQDYHLHQFEAKKEDAKDRQIVMDDNPLFQPAHMLFTHNYV